MKRSKAPNVGSGRRAAAFAAMLLASPVAAQQAPGAAAPEGQAIRGPEKPSRWGPGDRVGAINEITPVITHEASRLIRTGKVYSLAIATQPDPSLARVYRVMLRQSGPKGANRSSGIEDMIISSPSMGTSMDGLGHKGRDGVHYNGVHIEDIMSPTGAKVFGIETIPPIATRGVLLDFVRHGKPGALTQATGITRDDIQAVAKAEGITIRRGDVVLLHTGWLQHNMVNPDESRIPGLGKDGARYLAEAGVVAVGADTPGVEVHPPENAKEWIPVHGILLVDNGVYLIEDVRTEELARDSAYEFMFVMAAGRLPGTVQATVNPVAIR